MIATGAGCGAGLRHDVLGSARTTAGTPGPRAAVAIAEPSDRHRVDVKFYLPRAALVTYEIACPGSTFEGTVGETFEQYRQRRLAQLRAERERQVNAAGSIIGAAVGSAGAGARVETPNAEAEAEVGVDGEAVGRAVADSSMPDVQLDPRDLGAQSHERRFEWVPPDAGQCSIALRSEVDGQTIDGVVADMTVVHVVDVGRERAEIRANHNAAALDVRASITASLVASGADPNRREKLRQAELERERAERARVEVRVRAERQVELDRERVERERQAARERVVRDRERIERQKRIDLEAQARHEEYLRRRRTYQAAYRVRGELVAKLVAGGCDPNKRQREREQLYRRQQLENTERARIEREHRLRLQRITRGALEVRGELIGVLIAGGADPDYRRKQNERELREFNAAHEGEWVVRGGYEPPPAPPPPTTTGTDVSVGIGVDATADSGSSASVSVEAPSVDVSARAGAAVEVHTDSIWVPSLEVVVEGVKVVRPGGYKRVKRRNRGVRRRDHR
jgi:hypothetical protein